MPNGHALLAPSSYKRVMVCAGSVALTADLPDDSNEHSEWGTAGHEVSKMSLDGNTDPAAFFHRRIDVGNCKTVEVDQEMVGCTRLYVNLVRQRVADYKLAGAKSVELFIEQRVPVGHITTEEGAEGTADAVIVVVLADDSVLLEVIDAKFGRGVKVYEK